MIGAIYNEKPPAPPFHKASASYSRKIHNGKEADAGAKENQKGGKANAGLL